MLASDVNNPGFAGATDPDSVMIVRFYKRAVRNNFKSKKENRPIFEDKIYVEYYPAGNTLLKMDVPAYDHHKIRFAKQWAYYQSTQKGDATTVGTPLSQWTILSPADVENLKGLKFETIENIAASSDSALMALGMGVAGMAPHVLRTRAQAYLAAAKDNSVPQQQAEEIERLRREAAERDEQHKKEMAELRAMIEAKAAEPKKAKREWTPEQRAAQGERLRKAREAKRQQAA